MNFELNYINSQIVQENKKFVIDASSSHRYFFFHFYSPATIGLENKEFEIPQGGCLIFKPEKTHTLSSNALKTSYDFIDFECYDESIFKELNLPINQVINMEPIRSIGEKIASLYEYSNQEKKRKVIIDFMLSDLFILISESINKKHLATSLNYAEALRSRFEKLRYDLYQNPANLSVNTLAKQIGFTPSYFNVLYKQFFYTTPLKDLDRARLDMVKKFLINGEKTFEIVKTVGFSNEEYFYYWFKKQTGLTIKQFINQSKKAND